MSGTEILVLGATGTTGRRVARALRSAGHLVRAASRSGPIRFDWADPGTWRAALTGAAGLYLMAPDGVDVEPDFVALAVDAGVQRIALLSSGAVEEMADQRLLDAERVVRAAGVPWTILRPSWFNQNFDEGFLAPSVMAGRVLMPVGDLRQRFVDADDIGAVAAAVLTGEAHQLRTYELRGPRAMTFAEAVAIVAAASGRTARFDGTPERYLQAQMDSGIPSAAAIATVEAFAALRARGDDEPNDVIHAVTGRPPTSFESYAARAAARGAWRN